MLSIHSLTELQKKYENERLARQRAEETLLETEKKKSELSVDLTQLNSMTDTLKADLRMEIEKVLLILGCVYL